jgi:isopenicillin N synthase-like dioxygenase
LTILPKTEIHFETHSLPITTEPANAIRAAAHGDINLITLLMGAQGKGQVQNHDEDWIDAIAEPDELVINVDMLSRYTNNKLNLLFRL